MKISVVGTGYVGLVSGTCFAELGHEVTCIDINTSKIELLKTGTIPLYEPGLEELIKRNVGLERLFFSTDYYSIQNARIVFLAVGTPETPEGNANLTYVWKSVEEMAHVLRQETVIAIKSTVPIGSANQIHELIAQHTQQKFHIVNNPEFLREGTAVKDFMCPDRIIIGYQDEQAAKIMEDLYAPLLKQGHPLYKMSNLAAEATKYAANCFLATKISFINEMAILCEEIGVDIDEVREGLSSDHRIGKYGFYPGPGYGGSCFPKDIRELLTTAEKKGVELKIARAADVVNKKQKIFMAAKIKKYFKDNLEGKIFAFWGVAFKAGTDDVRESPAIDMANLLIEGNAQIHYYDPAAGDNFLKKMNNHHHCKQFKDMYLCLDNCDGLVIMTEWREFYRPDLVVVKEKLNVPVIFDSRNIFKSQEILSAGFDYFGIGKHIPLKK